MAIHLPQGYSMRAPTRADAPAVADVVAACQQAETGKAATSTEEVLSDWETIDLAEEAVVVIAPDGRIVGSADLINRANVQVTVYGYVQPSYQGRGIGGAIVQWGEEWTLERIARAPSDAQVVVQHFIIAANTAARRLFEARGYRDMRHTYVMGIDLATPPPAPDWPLGIRVLHYVLGQNERITFEAYEDASRDIWGRPRGSFERFLAQTRKTSFDPSLWHLAEDGRDIAGMCLTEVVAGRGWVGFVGVRRPWRGRGLGLALMRHALGEYYRRGIRDVGLSVDAESRTGAPRLYRRAGMDVREEYARYHKELRPGRDLSDRSDTE